MASVVDFFNALSNPYKIALKKNVYDILKDRYDADIDDVLDRVAAAISTEGDYKKLGKLIAALFESGYFMSMQQYQEQLKKLGVQIAVKPQDQPAKPHKSIFPNQKSQGSSRKG